ncbi:MAG TPA: 3-phosphoshikimate 1-carboxyvinyltransferase [Candidatus Eisenbacteria bacterium]|nr:3-phosphoshikimate 1-carboxyvinyltransferase [Candidatus Eisenbacteria bacterium]
MPALVAGSGSRAVADVVVVTPAVRLRGELWLPGDKSISHRALMLALLARGESRIRGAGDGADVRSSAGIVSALGATVEVDRALGAGPASGTDADGPGTVDYRVISPGIDALSEPSGVLDCGNSGTTLRLFAGIVAGQPMRTVLDGDASLRRRPVARIIEPLRSMGAALEARQQDSLPPLTVVGRNPLTAVDWAVAVPSAQVKSAILLAGLRANGTTRVLEPVATRDHTERMLRARGVTVRSEAQQGGGRRIEIEGGAAVQAVDERVPGDVSAAAFWLVAAATHPDAELTIRGVGVNPTRRAVIDLLRAMGADIEERPSAPTIVGAGSAADLAGDAEAGEPIADLVVRSSSLRAIDLGPAEVAAAIDELPILCLAATQAAGRTTVRGAGELRHKESDRLAGIARGLGALGARIELDGDDLTIDGPTRLGGASTDSLGDHRLAMTFAVAGLIAGGTTTVDGARSAAISYPGFFTALEGLRS